MYRLSVLFVSDTSSMVKKLIQMKSKNVGDEEDNQLL